MYVFIINFFTLVRCSHLANYEYQSYYKYQIKINTLINNLIKYK